jgi:hypothetical protein
MFGMDEVWHRLPASAASSIDPTVLAKLPELAPEAANASASKRPRSDGRPAGSIHPR